MLEKLGLIRRKDFVHRGKITHANAEKARRLHRKVVEHDLAGLLRSGAFQRIAPRSPHVRRALARAQPEEFRRVKLPFLLIRTGTKDGRPNPIRRVRVNKGYIVLETDLGRIVRLTMTGPELARDQRDGTGVWLRTLRRAARGMEVPVVRIQAGAWAIGRVESLSSVEARVAYLQGWYSNFDDWFRGFEELELSDLRAAL